VIDVTPTAKYVPFAGPASNRAKVTPPQLSPAKGRGNETFAPQNPGALFTTKLEGQTIVGTSASNTLIEIEHELVSPAASLA